MPAPKSRQASRPPTPIGTSGTTLTAYDSQGIEVPVSLYFVKTGPDLTANPAVAVDTWDVFDKGTLAAGTANLATNGATYATHTANVTWNTANPGPQPKTHICGGRYRHVCRGAVGANSQWQPPPNDVRRQRQAASPQHPTPTSR